MLLSIQIANKLKPKIKSHVAYYRNPRSYMEVERIILDFVVGLPETQKQYDSIWVAMDRLTKCAHFIPIKSTYREEDYARIFIDETVCRHGILLTII